MTGSAPGTTTGSTAVRLLTTCPHRAQMPARPVAERMSRSTPRRTGACWSTAHIPDQTGRVVVVTGANSGIGYVTSRELCRRGAHVVLACRSRERGGAAQRRIRAEVSGARAEVRQLDLARLDSVREFADTLDHESVDLLVNNAGVVMVPFSRTADGFETQFAVNHLGPFALTGLLMSRLLGAEDPRVVTVSSESQLLCRLDLAGLNSERGYNAAAAYARSKQANVYFAMQLQRWAAGTGAPLRSMVAVPGLTDTDVLSRGGNQHRSRLWRRLVPALVGFAAQPVGRGALPSLYAATVPDLPGGSYIAPSGPLQTRGEPAPRNGRRAVYDETTARRLWEMSEELTGVHYPGTVEHLPPER